MMKNIYTFILLCLLVLILQSCSNSNSDQHIKQYQKLEPVPVNKEYAIRIAREAVQEINFPKNNEPIVTERDNWYFVTWPKQTGREPDVSDYYMQVIIDRDTGKIESILKGGDVRR